MSNATQTDPKYFAADGRPHGWDAFVISDGHGWAQIDGGELNALMQRVGSANDDLERLRHIKTAAKNYSFTCQMVADVLKPMAQSPNAAVEAVVVSFVL